MSQTYLSTKNELSWHQLVCRGTSGILCLPIWKDIKYNIWVQMEYMSNNICLKLTCSSTTSLPSFLDAECTNACLREYLRHQKSSPGAYMISNRDLS